MPRDAQSAQALAQNIRHRISYTRDILTNDVMFEREKKRLEDLVAEFQKQLDSLCDVRANGERYIDQWKDQLLELGAERRLHDNRGQIEELLKAQRKINELEARTS